MDLSQGQTLARKGMSVVRGKENGLDVHGNSSPGTASPAWVGSKKEEPDRRVP